MNTNSGVAFANGYDLSLMNGLQALPRWNEFINKPAGARLGFINATYWRKSLINLRRKNGLIGLVGNGINFPISA
jgi:hypothetical protein